MDGQFAAVIVSSASTAVITMVTLYKASRAESHTRPNGSKRRVPDMMEEMLAWRSCVDKRLVRIERQLQRRSKAR